MIREKTIRTANGWVMLFINLGIILLGIWLLIDLIKTVPESEISWKMLFSRIFLIFLGFVSLNGHFALQPNEARVLMLAGKYIGPLEAVDFTGLSRYSQKKEFHCDHEI